MTTTHPCLHQQSSPAPRSWALHVDTFAHYVFPFFSICAPFALFPCRMLSGKFRSRLIPLHFPFALDCCCCCRCRWHVSQPVSQLANNQLLPARRELIICKGSQMRPAVAVAVAITTTALLTSSPVLSPPTTTLLLLLLLTTVCTLSQARQFVQQRQNTWLVGWLVGWLVAGIPHLIYMQHTKAWCSTNNICKSCLVFTYRHFDDHSW